jgi:hypothetical protein
MCSIAGNSLTLLIFVIVQGYILRDHSDWDAILVLILACKYSFHGRHYNNIGGI